MESKKEKIILLGVGVLAVSIFSYYFLTQVNLINQNKEGQKEIIEFPKKIITKFKEQSNSEGGVTVMVIPEESFNLKDRWNFDISLATHSVELSQDLTEVVVLIDAEGNEYKAMSWQGDPLGGHHRRGILTFNAIPKSNMITLIIREVAGVDKRVFKWDY